MSAPKKKPLARSLGEFFGILTRAVKTDVSVVKPTVVQEQVQEQVVQTPAGPVTLRRRTIDEIEPGVPRVK